MKRRFASYLVLSLVSCVSIVSCSSAPQGSNRPEPPWIHEPARRVDGGYIIYVGSGEDTTLERSHFKASSMALQDLVNECSIAPKGTRTEDSYDHPEGEHQFRSYVKVAIEFQDCEAAKQAVQPEDIRKLASQPLTEQLKRYQVMIDEPMPEELATADEGDHQGLNPMVNGGYTPSDSSSSSAWRTRIVVVNNPDSYFWMRQQVAYDKQVVVLAPVSQYQPGTPQTQAFVQNVLPAATQIKSFEKQNPETQTWNKSYSQSPVRQAKISQIKQARALSKPHPPKYNPHASDKLGQSSKSGVGGHVAKQPRRRKRWAP
jgi:hypothetical protein